MLLVWILSTCELGIGCHYRGGGGGLITIEVKYNHMTFESAPKQ